MRSKMVGWLALLLVLVTGHATLAVPATVVLSVEGMT